MTSISLQQSARLSVAPMMDWTDRHCRFFHRQISHHALLYTEMVTAAAVVHGKRGQLLDFDAAEHPIALQLGGSDPALLAEACKIATDWGYDEINLNVGCPSDRVQSAAFGACLMRTPDLVADCVAAMQVATPLPVTVKCRIGVDDQVPAEVLPAFLETVSKAGVTDFTIHARMAWLQGLSPKENRDIPPLDYALVHQMKHAFPSLRLSINGGITTLDAVFAQLAEGMDGVMIGRAAYHQPYDILAGADTVITGDDVSHPSRTEVLEAMKPYIAAHVAAGGRLHHITRHMLGLFAGQPGARAWKRSLSEGAADVTAGLEVIEAAAKAQEETRPHAA